DGIRDFHVTGVQTCALPISIFRPGMGVASPSISLSIPAMIFSSVDLPDPFRPRTPILAPGKKDREMSRRICRFGGTILPTRFIEIGRASCRESVQISLVPLQ